MESAGFSLLPKASAKSARNAIVVSSLIFFAIAVQYLRAFADMYLFVQPVLAVLLAIEAVGLWQLRPWARTAALWFWGIIIILAVVGCLANPFFWHDFFSLPQPLGWGLPGILVGITVLGIWCWRVLRAHSSAFQNGGRT